MPKVTKIELQERDQQKEFFIEVDDKAATRQAIINQVNKKLEKEYQNKFIERSGWNAKKPKNPLSEEWDYNSIVIHHQGNESFGFICSDGISDVQKIQQSEMNGAQNFDDIAYHYIVGCNGNILEGRDIRFLGSHVKNNNLKKIGILLLGDYSELGEVEWDKRSSIRDYILDNIDVFHSLSIPTAQANACIILITALISVFKIEKLGGHREFALQGDHRICPGNIGMQFVTYLREFFNLSAPEKVL